MTAAEALSRATLEVAASVDALVVVTQLEEEEEEEEVVVPAAGSGAVCSRSLGRTPPA